VAQLAPKNCEHISVEYAGDCAQYAEVLTDAVLKGFMAKTVDTALNLINARYYADQRGLKVRETSSKESGTFTDMVSISLGKEAAYSTVSASIFGADDYRIVSIDGFGIELRLEGDIVLYRNADVPGMLAAVSSALAAQNINIGALSLGRFQRGEDAITAITVDKHLEPKELDAVSQVKGVRELMYIMMV
jgi:D-3-phosphoglycerate dehydrogenase